MKKLVDIQGKIEVVFENVRPAKLLFKKQGKAAWWSFLTIWSFASLVISYFLLQDPESRIWPSILLTSFAFLIVVTYVVTNIQGKKALKRRKIKVPTGLVPLVL